MIRADLPAGTQAAQLIHAAGQSSPGDLPANTYAVALTVPDEGTLRALAATLERAGLPRHLIVESDAPYTGQAMALGIPPTDRKLLKKYLSSYPLVK